MSLTKLCDTKNIRFTPSSIQALERIRTRVDLGNHLAGTLGLSPLVELFLNPKSVTQLPQDVYEYHWEEFGQAMASVNKVLRYRVWEEANMMASYTSGEEREFWKCVIQVTR